MTLNAKAAPAPHATRQPTSSVVHGTELRDDYGWLRAGNWQEALRDPAVLPEPIKAHLVAENAYAEAVLAPVYGCFTEGLSLPDLREASALLKEFQAMC